jgi:ATPase subunit of ABC transporter with duplicated ATPase domains
LTCHTLARRAGSIIVRMTDHPGNASSRPARARDECAPASAGSGDSVVSAIDLTRRFGGLVAIDAANFEVGPHEIFGLIGPNGAGKSTLIKMLTALLPPSSERARVAGVIGQEDLRAQPSCRDRACTPLHDVDDRQRKDGFARWRRRSPHRRARRRGRSERGHRFTRLVDAQQAPAAARSYPLLQALPPRRAAPFESTGNTG